MRNCRRKSSNCNKCNKNCGCNKPVKPCGCNQELQDCSQYKKEAQEKCEKAECLNNKANKLAQEAIVAEKKAECLKEQAIAECERANQLWEERNRLSQQVLCLMKQAENCLAKSAECYANLYDEVEGCDLSQFGCSKQNNCNCGCNCGCGR